MEHAKLFLSTVHVVRNISVTKEALPHHVTQAKRVEQHRLAQKHLHSPWQDLLKLQQNIGSNPFSDIFHPHSIWEEISC